MSFQTQHRTALESTEIYLLIEALGLPIINPDQDKFVLRDCELFMNLKIYHRANQDWFARPGCFLCSLFQSWSTAAELIWTYWRAWWAWQAWKSIPAWSSWDAWRSSGCCHTTVPTSTFDCCIGWIPFFSLKAWKSLLTSWSLQINR